MNQNYPIVDGRAQPYYLAFVVRGDIYIEPGVTRVGATLIAVPDSDGSKGEIFTCDGRSRTSGLSANVCGNQLTIVGTVIANRVNFERTNGAVSSGGAAAERIIANPDLFLAGNTVFRTDLINNRLEIDTLQDLPPVY